MNEDPVEAALPRLVVVFVTQVPLAENAAGIAGRLQKLWQCRGREGQPFAFVDRVGDTGAEFVTAGHERRTRRRTGRARVKLSQPHALLVEPIEVRRADHRIAMGLDVAVALIVGHHVNDVWPFSLHGSRWPDRVGRRIGRGERAALLRDPVPGCLQFGHARRLVGGEVRRLAAVGGEIIELPRRALRSDELPVACSHAAMTFVTPPERVMRGRGGGIPQGCGETPTVQGRHRLSGVLARWLDARQLQDRRHDVDHVHRLRAKLALGGNAPRPMHDPGRRDAPLVHPGLVPPKGCVGATRPARAEA